MDHQIPTRKSDLMLINKKKKTCHLVDFAVSADHNMKIKKRKDEQILGSCQRAEKAVDHKGKSDTNSCWYAWNGPQSLGIKTEGIWNQKKNWGSPDHSIVKIH